jgi:enamine deaminase RidA (YjgF/YER057c/UK114 family)
MSKRIIPAPGLFESRKYGFSQIVEAMKGRLVCVSGQVAWDEDEQIVGGMDLGRQARKACENLRTAMEQAGGTLQDIVMLRIYVVNYREEDGHAIGDVLREFFGTEAPPASTWLGVTSLSRKEFLVEIEAQAVIRSRLFR